MSFYTVSVTANINDVLITALLRILVALRFFVSVCCAKNRCLLVAPASRSVQMADYSKLSRVIGMI